MQAGMACKSAADKHPHGLRMMGTGALGKQQRRCRMGRRNQQRLLRPCGAPKVVYV